MQAPGRLGKAARRRFYFGCGSDRQAGLETCDTADRNFGGTKFASFWAPLEPPQSQEVGIPERAVGRGEGRTEYENKQSSASP